METFPEFQLHFRVVVCFNDWKEDYSDDDDDDDDNDDEDNDDDDEQPNIFY